MSPVTHKPVMGSHCINAMAALLISPHLSMSYIATPCWMMKILQPSGAWSPWSKIRLTSTWSKQAQAACKFQNVIMHPVVG